MPDLTSDDLAEIAKMLREWLASDKWVLSPMHVRRKAILAKLEPQRERQVAPMPPIATHEPSI